MSDYLFDKEGPPDPEIAELEAILSPLAYREGPAPVPPKRRRLSPLWIAAGALAAIALVIVALRPRPPTWTVRVVDGEATIDGHRVSGEARVAVGAWIETGASHVELLVAGMGTAELAPDARARVTSMETVAQLELARGTLHARIAAPPRRFVVQTPHATATDLGCDFSVAVDADGRGRLVVTEGKVALGDGPSHELVIPAGRACGFDEHGVGTPYRAAAAVGFREAIERAARDPAAVVHAIHYATLEDIPDLRIAAAGRADVGALIDRRVTQLTPPVDAPVPVRPANAPTTAPVKHEKPHHGSVKAAPPKAVPVKAPVPVKTTPVKATPVKQPVKQPVKPAPDPRKHPSHDSMGDLERSTE
jgi:hypothetical protein